MKFLSFVLAPLSASALTSGSQAEDTPVTKVVGLLKEMQATLQKDMEDDEASYKELACWCNDGKYEREEAIKAGTAKVESLTASIEGLTAKSSELSTTIKELGAQISSDTKALDEATVLREKELAEFHGLETDNIQALENLRAAITVLEKHQNAPPESTVAGGAIFKSASDSWSLLQASVKEMPWSADAVEVDRGTRNLEDFMRKNGFDEGTTVVSTPNLRSVSQHKFLQASASATSATWSEEDSAVVRKALRTVAAFVQQHHRQGYYPAYTSQSGEIFGVLKQLEEEMSGDLSSAQKLETERKAAFAELREAKTAQIREGEKLEEQKEDELATTDNTLAESKEDLEEEEKVLAENQEFLKNLESTCSTAESDFDKRKEARLEEMKAVAETIQILQEDEARDAMSSTYATEASFFLQLSSASNKEQQQQRRAAALLRAAGQKAGNPALLALASTAELDAFTKVKEAIDGMVATLKQQMEDEVKKNDWCKDELHSTEMTTAKTEDLKAELEAKSASLEATIKTLSTEIKDSHAMIAQNQLDLQRATEDRKKENLDFQKTIADQTMTIAVLKKALDRLATYYDLLQTKSGAKQTPPVAQKEYSPNKASTGVMEMIEKLIFEAGDLQKAAKSAEMQAQVGYETLIADTNGAVAALQKEIVSKTAAKADAEQELLSTQSSLGDTVRELEGLAKYNAELHQECDYLLKNFDLRQSKRGEEIEALQQAKQILSGAALS
mmetsp:Transcript_78250/g.162498  ORF Transcript_78250/g.162498 Transcript_78250/m.162498 type:complete len:732 (+) Transcript_78250:148-2343(+)|eukprot:CAMPEP_0206445536 /NCGR_PEP_ID=MMETSP0324_2-20121206/15577_1 /ASSEMBLY_ACC=CAM_ASM_000836 /TAXON_ID=2866 /ORGANISM="Crypthecodinium cohnii, Strain Seligo" /LENGTH=731 /DNA_ID=CAMNT_0053913791 /DNA_START=148 /DNA_END=2343 /DNA_ORIENTATION=-